ncbi:unnamed protein product [Cyprideis torosa]|uniref:Putative 2'-deoxynucleoside 5'-phosphate N-hydrolase 1 n=1 Tax=Cyprideis torosa TaxID=163714 RepID=A0A7R8WQP0_9CRUS|nr:unnamed protein product [Cyprideis torosa]CAG0903225.1 unnamed protein product [Cyprideis torosa]
MSSSIVPNGDVVNGDDQRRRLLNIYMCGSIRGGRQDIAYYIKLAEILEKYGTVLTPFVADPKVTDEHELDNRAIFLRDTELLQKADIFIAECTVTSLGVGFEIGWAMRHRDFPVLCLYRPSPDNKPKVSALVLGIDDGDMYRVRKYHDVNELPAIIKEFVDFYWNDYILRKVKKHLED